MVNSAENPLILGYSAAGEVEVEEIGTENEKP